MYLNTATQEYPVSLRDIRKAHPNVSLPKEPGEATLNTLGYATVQPTERPSGDVVTEGQPEQRDDVWYQTWEVREFTAEEAVAWLEQAKREAMQRINAGYQDELAHILADYPDAETKGWDKQEAEARAWQADNTADTPLIDSIATARSMDKAELVSRIIAKADAWIAAYGAATGKRQALEDQIAAATTVDEANAINW